MFKIGDRVLATWRDEIRIGTISYIYPGNDRGLDLFIVDKDRDDVGFFAGGYYAKELRLLDDPNDILKEML